MWPFRKRDSDESIGLGALKTAVETNPATRYVNCLLLEMVRTGVGERTFRESESLPVPAYYAPRGLPPFAAVVNRLKILSNLDPVICHEPKEGSFEIRVDDPETLTVRLRFDDAGSDRSVRLRIEKQTTTDEASAP